MGKYCQSFVSFINEQLTAKTSFFELELLLIPKSGESFTFSNDRSSIQIGRKRNQI